MNNLKTGVVQIKGKGKLIHSKSPLEQIVEETENEASVSIVENMAVPASEPVIEKHQVGEIIEKEIEASVEPVIVKENEMVELPKSKRTGFNPNSVSNVVHAINTEDDGGVVANKMAIPQDAEGSQFIPIGNNAEEIETKNKYEITGFSIQYQPKGSKGIASEEVRDYYDSLDESIQRFNNDTYLKPDGTISRISRGGPVICFNDRQIMEYINEMWRKS